MNSTFLRILAVLMVIAAIATAMLGYRISHRPPDQGIKVVVPTYAQVMARSDLQAGHVLTAEDLEVSQSNTQDSQSFSDPERLLGKVITSPVIKGAPLKRTHLPGNSALGQHIAPHERAVAIKVNEVVGVGGFIKPGDHVDVLFYLRSDRETSEVSSAQVVLSDVKVLAYGTRTSEPEPAAAAETAPQTPNKLGSNRKSELQQNKDSKSAILAVHEQQVAKLMLADSTGILRLALRGATTVHGTSAAADNQLVRLQELAQSAGTLQPAKVSNADATASKASKKKSSQVAPRREQVIVHRGDAVEVIRVAK